MFSTNSPLELNQHRMLLSSDSDTNEPSASFGLALSCMSSRIHSSLCSSPPLSIDAVSSVLFGWSLQNRHASVRKSFTYFQFDCTIIPWNDDLNLPIKIRTDTLRKVLNSTYDQARSPLNLEVEQKKKKKILKDLYLSQRIFIYVKVTLVDLAVDFRRL